MVSECGAHAIRKNIVKDDAALLRRTILDSLADSDIVVINAGSSAGREDFTADVIAELATSLYTVSLSNPASR